jgi:asparagine synthase (glutamine-hydrolysing)
MFAVALWDANRRRLVLGRDRLGKKPLVYRHERGRLLFASELKSLLEVPGLPREIDPAAVDEYLTYQYIPHPEHDLSRLSQAAARLLRGVSGRSAGGQTVLAARFRRRAADQRQQAIEELRELLDSAVRMRMRSDVPLGAFLSGGVDSSLIVALMQKHSAEPVKTFTIGFPVKEYDETKYARRVAEHLGRTTTTLEVRARCASRSCRSWRGTTTSRLPTARRFPRGTCLGADAAARDGGAERRRRRRAVCRLSAVSRGRGAGRFGSTRRWFDRRRRGCGSGSPLRAGRSRSSVRSSGSAKRWRCRPSGDISTGSRSSRAATGELYRDEFLASCRPIRRRSSARRGAGARARRGDVRLASRPDTYLACDLMTKVDIASMAHGLECRAPLLDYRVVEFAASLPVRLKYRRGKGKWLLREAFGHLLPREIFTRRKMGFGVPLDYWFRHELKDLATDLLLSDSSRCHAMLRPEAIRALWDDHQAHRYDHSARLWSLVMLEAWLREWGGAEGRTSEVERCLRLARRLLYGLTVIPRQP